MVSHTISQLTRAYALLRGRYEVIEREIEHVNGINNMLAEIARIGREKAKMLVELNHIAATAKHLDPSWQRERVRPIYPRRKDRKSGIVANAAYSVLREAKIPLRSREISRKVAVKLGIELNERELARLDIAIASSLNAKVGRTIQKTEENPTKWAFLPRDQVRSEGKYARAAKRTPRDKLPPLPRKYRRPNSQSNGPDQK